MIKAVVLDKQNNQKLEKTFLSVKGFVERYLKLFGNYERALDAKILTLNTTKHIGKSDLIPIRTFDERSLLPLKQAFYHYLVSLKDEKSEWLLGNYETHLLSLAKDLVALTFDYSCFFDLRDGKVDDKGILALMAYLETNSSILKSLTTILETDLKSMPRFYENRKGKLI